MLTDEICSVVLLGAECRKVCMARLACVGGFDVIMACVARCHGGHADRAIRRVHIFMARLALNILIRGMGFMRKHKLALELRSFVGRLITACMAKRAICLELFFVAALAVFVLADQVIRRELTCCRFLMAISAGDPRIFDVKLMGELNRFLFGFFIPKHFAGTCQSGKPKNESNCKR